MKIFRFVCALTMLLSVVGAVAQQMEMTKPAPELKQYEYFVGSWKLDGDAKPSPMGPGGKMSMTEDVKWMRGGYFLVINSNFSGAGMGAGTGISIMGYDSDEKKYSYNEFNSFGESVRSFGNFDGKTWNWSSDDKMGKGRYTMTVTSPKTYDFQFDISKDGKEWMTVMTGKATKIK